MDHLKDKFRESLIAEVNDDGLVEVAGTQWTPAQILETDEPAFEAAFIDWRTERENELITEADRLLGLTQSNRNNFTALKQVYQRQPVHLFAGAGVSMSSGYPGWTKFLYDLVDDATTTNEALQGFLDAAQYEEAASHLEAHMPNGAFHHAVTNTFDINRDIAGPVQDFPRFFNGSVITTNFDNVLRRAFEDQGLAFDEYLVGTQAEDFRLHIGRGERVLVKLHGNAHSRNSRILTTEEYDRAYPDAGALQHLIEAICGQTLLFIGCSLATDRTLQAMINYCQRMANQNLCHHYAFLKLEEEDRVARQHQLAQANIIPIWYDGDHDECIEALLLKLEG